MNGWMQFAAGVAAAVATILGAYGTYRQARGTERRTVADMYGEALDRLDGRLNKAEARIDELEAALRAERDHSIRQDKRIARLRSIVTAWAEWGARLQAEWESIRRNPVAPTLPNVEQVD